MTRTRTFSVSLTVAFAVALLAAAAIWASASLAGGPNGGGVSSEPSSPRSDGGPAFVQDERGNCPDRARAGDSGPAEEPSV
jgi:hypothetical protein